MEIHYSQQLSLTNLLVKHGVNAFILEERAPHRTEVRSRILELNVKAIVTSRSRSAIVSLNLFFK